MNNLNNFIYNLRATAWKTSCSRFNCSRRLKRREWFAVFSIALFSILGILLSIIERIIPIQIVNIQGTYLILLSVFIGMFVIVISLIEWGTSNSVRVDNLYHNAEELNKFQRLLEQRIKEIEDGKDIISSEAQELREIYNNIVNKCPFNHDEIDYLLFQAKNRLSADLLNTENKPNINLFKSWYIIFHHYILSFWLYGIFWLILLFLLWRLI